MKTDGIKKKEKKIVPLLLIMKSSSVNVVYVLWPDIGMKEPNFAQDFSETLFPM
jgi:hypothetical protein